MPKITTKAFMEKTIVLMLVAIFCNYTHGMHSNALKQDNSCTSISPLVVSTDNKFQEINSFIVGNSKVLSDLIQESDSCDASAPIIDAAANKVELFIANMERLETGIARGHSLKNIFANLNLGDLICLYHFADRLNVSRYIVPLEKALARNIKHTCDSISTIQALHNMQDDIPGPLHASILAHIPFKAKLSDYFLNNQQIVTVFKNYIKRSLYHNNLTIRIQKEKSVTLDVAYTRENQPVRLMYNSLKNAIYIQKGSRITKIANETSFIPSTMLLNSDATLFFDRYMNTLDIWSIDYTAKDITVQLKQSFFIPYGVTALACYGTTLGIIASEVVKLYDLTPALMHNDQQELHCILKLGDPVMKDATALVFNKEKLIIRCARTLHVFDIYNKTKQSYMFSVSPTKHTIFKPVFAFDGTDNVACYNNFEQIIVFNIKTKNIIQQLTCARPKKLTFSSDGTQLLAVFHDSSHNEHICSWKIKHKELTCCDNLSLTQAAVLLGFWKKIPEERKLFLKNTVVQRNWNTLPNSLKKLCLSSTKI